MVASAQGLDVSNFQGSVNWGTLKKGLSFAFAKATESTNFTDAYFAHNWAGMASAGLHRGAYHFFHPGVDAVAQARYFVNTVKAQGLKPGDILAADVEITAGAPLEGELRNSRLIVHADGAKTLPARTLHRQDLDVHAPAEMTAGSVASAAYAFCSEVANLTPPSCPLLIYTNLTVGNTLTGGCSSFPLWMAYPAAGPPPLPAPWKNSGGAWRFWQWGLSNGIDADAFNGTASMLTTWIASYQPAPTENDMTPGVIFWQDKPYYFGVGTDGILYVKDPGGQFAAVHDHTTGNPARFISGVSAAVDSKGRIVVVGKGTDNEMWQALQESGGTWTVSLVGGRLA